MKVVLPIRKTIKLKLLNKNINPIALKLYNKLGYKEVGESNWRKGLFILPEKVLKQ